MYVGLSVLLCLILVVLADFIHNIKKTGEELGKVSEHKLCLLMVGLCMLCLIDCSVTMTQAHGWAFYEVIRCSKFGKDCIIPKFI